MISIPELTSCIREILARGIKYYLAAVYDKHTTEFIAIVFDVCVKVLRPTQSNEVMSSAGSLPNHTFTVVNQYRAHSFARNWQLPFLDQRKGENDRRKYFMINLHERMLPTSAGVKLATSLSPVGRASN